MAKPTRVALATLLCLCASTALAAPLLQAPTALIAGGPNTVVVTGARPGANVVLAGSISTNFTPFCPPQIAPTCLDLPTPSVALGTVPADASGRATFVVRPPFVPALGFAGLQAVERRGTGALTSNVELVRILSAAGDQDLDGLSNGDEVFVHGTDPELADTDGGGEQDGAEVARGANPLSPSDDCAVAIARTVPGDGDVDVDVRATLLVDFSVVPATPVFTLQEVGGLPVPVQAVTTVGSTRYEVVPFQELLPGSLYDLSIASSCGAVESFRFTTGGAHTPTPLTALAGRTWALDPFSGTLVEPAQALALLQSLLGGPGAAQAGVMFTGQTGGGGDLVAFGQQLLDAGAGPAQDACYVSVPVGGIVYDEGTGRLDFDVQVDLDYQGLVMPVSAQGTAWVLGNGASLSVAEIQGSFDITPFAPVVGATADAAGAAQLCGLVASFGLTTCTPCADGRPVCLAFEARNQVWPETTPTVIRSAPDATCPGPTGCGDGCSQSGPGGALGLLGLLLVGLRRRRV